MELKCDSDKTTVSFMGCELDITAMVTESGVPGLSIYFHPNGVGHSASLTVWGTKPEPPK